MTHKQVIVIRKDLNMRKGKMVAQGCHASLGAILDLLETKKGLDDPRAKPWLEGRFKKVCVSVDSEEELIEIYNKAQNAGIITKLIIDAGLTEFGGVATKTCVAVGPDTEENVDKITGHLKLL
jgi:PTH2 family peptidyl-tRNA hydrolase